MSNELKASIAALGRLAADCHDAATMTPTERAELVSLIGAHTNIIQAQDFNALPKLLTRLRDGGDPNYSPFLEVMASMQERH